MTPNDIEVLLHCHVSPVPHPRRMAPAVARTIDGLIEHGLIIDSDSCVDVYTTTERGRAHVNQLCNLSWPVQKWADANGDIIREE